MTFKEGGIVPPPDESDWLKRRSEELERVKPLILGYVEMCADKGITKSYFEIEFMGTTKAFISPDAAVAWLAYERNWRPFPKAPDPKPGDPLNKFGGRPAISIEIAPFFIFIGAIVVSLICLVVANFALGLECLP
jgi:hypothetical protein